MSFLAEFVGAAGRAHALSLYARAGRIPGLAGTTSYDVTRDLLLQGGARGEGPLDFQNHLYVLDSNLKIRLSHLHKTRRTVVAIFEI